MSTNECSWILQTVTLSSPANFHRRTVYRNVYGLANPPQNGWQKITRSRVRLGFETRVTSTRILICFQIHRICQRFSWIQLIRRFYLTSSCRRWTGPGSTQITHVYQIQRGFHTKKYTVNEVEQNNRNISCIR